MAMLNNQMVTQKSGDFMGVQQLKMKISWDFMGFMI